MANAPKLQPIEYDPWALAPVEHDPFGEAK